ncbi:phytanoyl-CoA dioxygenase family protein [Pseudomonas sp. GM60]|uniref:phytanoyl-CoA dioxygenase family protein n=1 Tax=Pseudomonas sp. GM60 TaxID=1144334 RepID=UPI0002706625|nr:phytanoyl-CoA dioxygenase family protein [Pseudomonas sp. GM60]EJM82061.1 protein involved in biosynthesis of mitomycin antibiotics/polyketide fumonisin [Pseudomonas sp. GM60]
MNIEPNEFTNSSLARYFRLSGYLRISQAISQDKLQKIREQSLSLIPIEDDAYTFSKIRRISETIPESILTIFESDKIIRIITSILGPNVVLVKNRHNHLSVLPPNLNVFRLHRDVLQWSNTIISLMIYLQDTNEADGATHILPGSQHLDFIHHSGRQGHGGTWMDEHPEFKNLLDQAIPIPCRAGDALLIDGVAFHSPGTVISDTRRMVLTFALRAVDELNANANNDDNLQLVAGNWVYHGNNNNY